MKKRYFKNGYRNLIFLLISLVNLSIVIPVCIFLELYITETVIIATVFLSPFILYFLVGFYWVFQTVSIESFGIVFYLCKKKIIEIPWNEIQNITISNYKVTTYSVKMKEKNKYYSFDSTKEIEVLMEKYAPKELFY